MQAYGMYCRVMLTTSAYVVGARLTAAEYSPGTGSAAAHGIPQDSPG